MIMEQRDYQAFLEAIIDIIKRKKSWNIGCLVVGEKEQTVEIQQGIARVLHTQDIIHEYIDLHELDDEESCIRELKRAKKQLKKKKQPDNMVMLVIEAFDRMDTNRMDAIKVLIGCPVVGINLFVSAKKPMAPLVGITEYMVRINPSETTFSDLYRYKNEKVIVSLSREAFKKSKQTDGGS